MRPTVPLLILPFAWLAAPAADACSCPSPSLDVAIANADAIFVGEVVAIDSHLDVPNATCVNAPPFERITYAVQQVHKGCVEAEVHVLNNLDCGLDDAVGDIVAVFAGLGSDGNYRSGACSGSATPATLVGVLGDPAPPSDVTCPSRCLADGGISPLGPTTTMRKSPAMPKKTPALTSMTPMSTTRRCCAVTRRRRR